MIDLTITQTLVPFAGSGVCGYIAWVALRKILILSESYYTPRQECQLC
ncbi:MAG: hypothetical protein WA667_13855 [Candidatus Nitrosopolaris sp.]